MPAGFGPRKWEMDDASGHKVDASASETVALTQLGRSGSTSDHDALKALRDHPVQIPVTGEEIAILRAFLSTEIDAIINADEPVSRD